MDKSLKFNEPWILQREQIRMCMKKGWLVLFYGIGSGI